MVLIMAKEATSMRRSHSLSLVAAGALAASVAAPMAATAASVPAVSKQARLAQPTVTNVARVAAGRAWLAFEARMAARQRGSNATAAAPPPATAAPARAFGKITHIGAVSRDTLPSAGGAEPDTQTEPDIAIDPSNPLVIVAAAQQGRFIDGGSVDPGYATSQDGGKTWAAGNLPLLTQAVGGVFERASDVAVAFGPDGSAYAQTIPFNQTSAPSAVAVQRSIDGGLSFGPPSLVVSDNDINIFNDKNWIAVDTFKRSPHYGRVYSVWSRFITTGTGASAVTHSPGTVSYSDDHGQTWSPFRFTGAADADTEGLIPLIHPDGSITVVYDLTVGNNDFETAQTSHDGGNTWSAPVTVGQFLGAGLPGMRTGGLPAAAIDPSTGHMYVVWQDTRFNSGGLNDIVLSVSTDGGSSWKPPRAVSPRAAGLDRFTPAVAAAAGAVHITYGTRGAKGTAPSVTEDYLVSTNGGTTFGPQRQVGPPSVLRWAAVADTATRAFLGDYVGMAATPRVAVLTWCVASKPPLTGTFHQTMWAATVSR
jgi:BNR/Asp-box repeat